MGKTTLIALILIVAAIFFSACTAEPDETRRQIETIAEPVNGWGYNIQLRIGEIIYSPFGFVGTTNPNELDVPVGEQIGVAQGFEFIAIFSVSGQSPDEWLYGVYDNNGGITLFKADNVTDIPEQFYELWQACELL